MKKIITLSTFILGLILFVVPAQAQSQYPIKELGSCSNAASCYNYCQIPENTPACWSYGKYIFHKNVLGDQTASLTFPIAELGNCASAQACKTYCSQPANYDACSTFGRKRGLLKQTEVRITKEKLLQAAKEKLGCTDENSCKALCSDPANQEKCSAFAREVGLTHTERNYQSSRSQEFLDKAKQELGCDSQTACMNFCSQPENHEKCMEFAKKNFMQRRQGQQGRGQWCEQHPDQCNGTPGMRPSGMPQNGDYKGQWCEQNPGQCDGTMTPHPSGMYEHPGMMRPSGAPGNWQGNTPCTEGQCMNWCQQNPGKCPGYPQGGIGGIQGNTEAGRPNTMMYRSERPPSQNNTWQSQPPQN